MKKRLALSLLIMYSIFAHAMENNATFFDSFSYSTWFLFNKSPKESELISNLRKDRNDFENRVQMKLLQKLNGTVNTLLGFDVDTIKSEELCFLQYCYYYAYWSKYKEAMNLYQLDRDPIALCTCQNSRINGYSALGAAMIAENASVEEKRTLIQELTHRGFIPTPQDIELAKLALHDEIKEHRITILYLLHTNSHANWSVLPPEIREHSAHYLIELFKKEFWLLPEKD